MKFTQEEKEEIYKTYMERVSRIFDENDWKTYLEPKEVVALVLESVEEIIK